MGLVIGTKEQINEYFDSSALSQSTMKGLLQGIGKLKSNQEKEKELYYEEKGHLITGSAVDCILTGEEDQFDKEYYVSEVEKKPSDAILSVLHQVVDRYIELWEESKADMGVIYSSPIEYYYKEQDMKNRGNLIQIACLEQGYGKSYKEETRLTKVLDHVDLLEDLLQSHGKQILSVKEKENIDSVVLNLRTDPRTSKYFDRTLYENNKDVTVYYQLPIYWVKQGVQCKALLDLVVVIRDKDGVIEQIIPCDLKTLSGFTISFLKSVKSWRYDIQAAWYTQALESMFPKDKMKIVPYRFIVESTTNPGTPLVYILSPSLLYIGAFGKDPVKLGGTDIRSQIKGVKQLFEEYSWYEENGWEEERVIKDNDGVLTITWDEIVS